MSAVRTEGERADPVAAEPAEAVLVHLGGGRFAVPLASVTEVGRVPAVTRLPGVPGWLAGVANWRGRVLAVADVRPLLGVAAAPVGQEGRLVVLHDGGAGTADRPGATAAAGGFGGAAPTAGVTVGIVADGVGGVMLIDPATVEPVLATLPPAAAALLDGQITTADGPVGLLAVAAVFALRRTLPAVRSGG